MKRNNKIAKSLFTKKYKPRIVKPKKGKGSFKRKKNSLKNSNFYLIKAIKIHTYHNSILFSVVR